MRFKVPALLFCCCFYSIHLSAAAIRGKVVDPSGAPVPGAQVSLVDRVGVEAQALTAIDGTFELKDGGTPPDAKLVITATGFGTRELPVGADGSEVSVKLDLAPVVDTVRVVGSAVEVPASEQGSSVSIVPREEIRQRNEPLALDLLRELPSLSISQTGLIGGVAGLYVRGGYPDFNQVQIDGVPVNAFGGNFDFAHIPSEELDRVEVVRGPQSAVYGPYANSSAINFVTRQPQSSANLDLLSEGGSYGERRFGISGGGVVAGFGIEASASRLDTGGPVENSDYHNEYLMLNIARRFGRQSLSLHGDFDSNNVGEPGPYGSDPKHTFTGIDTVSRSRNNFSSYLAHYEIDLTDRVRQEVFGTFFLNNSGYASPYGGSFNKDLRGGGEERTTVSVTRHYTAAMGVSETLEEVTNTFITDAAYDTFPIRRNDTGVYLENRFEIGHLFLNAGVRGDFIRTGAIPGDGYSRPFFPSQLISTANPKLAAAYVLGATRFHASFGMGLRPPAGFDLAYTNNPSLQPERTRGFDAGVQRTLLSGRVAFDATYFYNRYYDLIVILGGSLTQLSHYQSDNIANSHAQGAEFSAGLRPARWVFVNGTYTYLDTKILSLNGAAGLAPQPFSVGQPLLRRPANSGSIAASFTRGRVTANVTGYFRGQVLDVEPSLGATNGLFWNPGYANVGVNLNYSVGRGLTAYGNLRNALNQHYEEVFGFPSPRLNFVAGLKWVLPRTK